MSDAQRVFCVVCISPGDDRQEVTHIFSTGEKANAFMSADKGRSHVAYDYVIDCPERMEGAALQ